VSAPQWSNKNEALYIGDRSDDAKWCMAVVDGEPSSNELVALAWGYSPEGVASRARLIAAAPNLMEHGVHALRELDVFAALIHHQDQREEVQAIADRFRAAISKATDVQGGGR